MYILDTNWCFHFWILSLYYIHRSPVKTSSHRQPSEQDHGCHESGSLHYTYTAEANQTCFTSLGLPLSDGRVLSSAGVCNLQRQKSHSPSWELRTASPRGHYGERLQRDSCLKKHMKKHHPLAGDSPWRHYRRDHNIRTAGRIHHQLFRLHWLVCLKKRAFW